MLAHSSERANSDSEGDASTVETKKVKHSVHAYFRKNQKRSILQSEKYGDLTTTKHKILNEGSESRNDHQSETSGIAERAVRRIKEETSAVLLQSGSDDKWWSDSMECYCSLRDDQDLLADGRRFGESFQDMLCSRVEFGKNIF